MKILIATQFFLDGSGSGIYAQNVARELMELGHDVRVLCADNVPVVGKSYPVKTIIFDASGKGKGDINFNVPFFTTHPKSNQQFYSLSDEQFLTYVNIMGKFLKDDMDSFKPDVVHCHHASIFSYHLSKFGVPYVITLHGTDLMGFRKEPRFKEMVIEGARGAYSLIAISKQVAAEARELLHVGEDKIALIHNGFDDKLFYPRNITRSEVLNKYGLTDTPKHLVSFVGKLAYFKGVDVLIRAAQIYEKNVDGVLTLIVGQGQLREELETLVKDLGVKGVRFLGHKNQNEVAEIYSVADVSVVPSREEPFGLVAIEAMACGTPVVATRGGGLVDFVNDKVGRLVNIDDCKQLADGITDEIKSNSKSLKGRFAAKYAKDGFAWRKPVLQMVNLFEKRGGVYARS